MKSKIRTSSAASAIAALALLLGLHDARSQGTKFTYQGRLLDAGSPASGNYDMRFTVWDSAVGGLQIGGPVVVNPVPVSSGLFTAPLDFGAGVFTGPQRWLQIESRLSGGPAYNTIAPRQELTASPYAVTAGNLTGTVPGGQLSGTVADANLSANVALLNRDPQTFTGQNNFANTLSLTDPTKGILFPATAGANVPMITMFASGTGNADRMVIAHSPSYPDWGLQYQDPPDKFNFLSGGSPVMTVDLGFQRVGIGTASPAAQLDVVASGQAYARLYSADAVNGSVFELRNDAASPTYVGAINFPNASATDGQLGYGPVNGMTFRSGGTEWMRITPAGNININDQNTTIQFPATAGPNVPMITMFASGTGNADRMVIAHSPSYPDWGLQYSDAQDKFNFLAFGTPVMTVDLGSQRVGIGTTTPTKAKLEIEGVSGAYAYGQRGILNLNGATSSASTGTDNNASFWASGNCWGSAFLAFSDERIKHIEGRSDAAHDLTTLLGIEVTDYTYIDTVAKSAGKQKKVIAQQVEKVYPQAVSRNTDAVPDIYKMAKVRNGWVKLATNLKKGERVRLIGAKKEGIHEVLEVAQDKFRTDFAADGDEVFVFGREVKDFRSVDYEAIAMLNVSATQELSRRLEKQAAELAARDGRIATLEKANAQMRKELAAQKQLASQIQARFATLEKALSRPTVKSGLTLAVNYEPAEAK